MNDETFDERLDRVSLMAGDSRGTKWDLSTNDRAALASVVGALRDSLRTIAVYETQFEKMRSFADDYMLPALPDSPVVRLAALIPRKEPVT